MRAQTRVGTEDQLVRGVRVDGAVAAKCEDTTGVGVDLQGRDTVGASGSCVRQWERSRRERDAEGCGREFARASCGGFRSASWHADVPDFDGCGCVGSGEENVWALMAQEGEGCDGMA